MIVEGRIEGKRGMGRKQMSWLKNWTGLITVVELVHTARSREDYANVVPSVNQGHPCDRKHPSVDRQ